MSDGPALVPDESARVSPELPCVSACRSGPETVVFIESENADGWIATDLTVDVDR